MDQKGELLNLIESTKEKKKNLHIELEGGGQLLILGADGLYRQSGCNLEELLCAGPANTSVKTLSAKSPSVMKARELGRELEELQWMMAYELSGGQLLYGSRDRVFKLKRWPNFTRIPHSDSCLKIAALLTRRATSIDMASRVLGVAIEDVKRFCSAAKVAGYMSGLEEKADVINLDDWRSQDSIIANLLMKLRRA